MGMDDCVHYWVIDSPNGKTSWGQCTACLVRREFQNAIGDEGWDWPAKNSLYWERGYVAALPSQTLTAE